jgi:hypothetical protein
MNSHLSARRITPITGTLNFFRKFKIAIDEAVLQATTTIFTFLCKRKFVS